MNPDFILKKSRKICILVQVFVFYHKSRLIRIPRRNLSVLCFLLGSVIPITQHAWNLGASQQT